MPDESRFWDRIAKRYARRPVPDEAVYQEKLRLTRALFGPESQVLELGCGTRSTAIAHAPHVGHILATDISAGMLEIARSKAAAAGVANLSFEQASVESLAPRPEHYDVVLAHSLLHLVEDKEAAIAKIHRLLKPGGHFVSSTACIGDKMHWFKLIAPLGRLVGLFPLVKVFKRCELIASIEAAGFEIERDWLPEKSQAVFVVARKPES